MYILELLTVQQYAKMAGISLPGAYKRLNGILKDRVHKVNGKIFIDVSGLDLNPLVESTDENIEEENQDESSNRAGLQDILKEKESLIFSLQTMVKSKDELIETLQSQYQAQLSAKDETIAALQAQVQQMQNQIDNLTQLLSQAQQIQMSQQLAVVQRKHSFWDRFFKR